jgi:hypothetical protein
MGARHQDDTETKQREFAEMRRIGVRRLRAICYTQPEQFPATETQRQTTTGRVTLNRQQRRAKAAKARRQKKRYDKP